MTTIEALNGLCRWLLMLMRESGKMWAYNHCVCGFSQLNVGSCGTITSDDVNEF